MESNERDNYYWGEKRGYKRGKFHGFLLGVISIFITYLLMRFLF